MTCLSKQPLEDHVNFLGVSACLAFSEKSKAATSSKSRHVSPFSFSPSRACVHPNSFFRAVFSKLQRITGSSPFRTSEFRVFRQEFLWPVPICLTQASPNRPEAFSKRLSKSPPSLSQRFLQCSEEKTPSRAFANLSANLSSGGLRESVALEMTIARLERLLEAKCQ